MEVCALCLEGKVMNEWNDRQGQGTNMGQQGGQAVMASQEDKASPAATVSQADRVSPAATVSRECMGRIPCIRDSSLPERITAKL